MSESSTGTTTGEAVGIGLAEIEGAHDRTCTFCGPGASRGYRCSKARMTTALRAIIELGDETPIQFVRRHGIDPTAGGGLFLACARADVLAILREAGL